MSSTPKTPLLYTVPEIAYTLRIHPRTAYRLIHDGKLRAVKVGSQWRVPEASLLEFIDKAGKPARRKKKEKGPKQLPLPLEKE